MAEIRINDTWTITPDPYSWKLTQSTPHIVEKDTVRFKAGERRILTKETWHGTLEQAMRKIVNVDAKSATDIEGILAAIETAHKTIAEAASKIARSRGETK